MEAIQIPIIKSSQKQTKPKNFITIDSMRQSGAYTDHPGSQCNINYKAQESKKQEIFKSTYIGAAVTINAPPSAKSGTSYNKATTQNLQSQPNSSITHKNNSTAVTSQYKSKLEQQLDFIGSLQSQHNDRIGVKKNAQQQNKAIIIARQKNINPIQSKVMPSIQIQQKQQQVTNSQRIQNRIMDKYQNVQSIMYVDGYLE